LALLCWFTESELRVRDPDLATRPNKFAAANGLTLDDAGAHLRGYQSFSVNPEVGTLLATGPQLMAKEAALEHLFSRSIMAGRSVLDLGGNNGYFAFKALQRGASSATVVDIDPECIVNLNRVKTRYPTLRLEAVCQGTDTWNRPADVVLAFALIHWVYSCTARALSLDRVVEALAALTRDALAVEWVDPADPLVVGFHHTEVATGGVAEPYDFEAFFQALNRRFSRVELLAELSPTRRIYLATRGPLFDYSWEAPLLFPTQTLLGSRMLWEAGGVQYWSRLYRIDGTVYRQCTPVLAEREVAARTALGEPVEVLERHPRWWLLRTAFVEGETLDERVARAPLSSDELTRLALQLLGQVERMAVAGVTHRDLHPANIVVDADGAPRLIDFGWACAAGLPELSPACLGAGVALPASRTVLDVRPPEGSGDDLYALGRIVGWANQAKDANLELFSRWLAHRQPEARLRDPKLARQWLEQADGPDQEGSARMSRALARLALITLESADRLEEANGALRRDRHALTQALSSEGTRAQRLESELRAATERVEVLETRTRELETRTRELETRNRELETRNSELQTRNSELQTRNSELQTRNSELQTRNSELQTRNSELQTRNRELETRNRELETRNRELETRNRELETRNSELEVRAEEVAARAAQLQHTCEAPGARDALRFAAAANRLRLSLAPEGTRRLVAFRTALHWTRLLLAR
jgi:hypothetical protein